ncbi:hypothetical protein [Neobacillus sp. PS3-40]|uniref:hypothetical protein n=1 Tax=Neobacillus sp. PS3-40 TaxID=3070679 RepID=UPI0027DFD686|nr:hypothetical protein [Neobacillus sp. PS3-40]WML45416.1 hypothetical protein RCG20_05805 [Neobacillus sp. PS3-40]
MKKTLIMFLLLLLSFLSACNNDKNIIDSPLYDGKNLTIGIVGKTPTIREKNVVFKEIEIENLTQDNLSSRYNAVLIMKGHVSGSSKETYAKIYKKVGIPIFFIEPQKYYIPSVDEEAHEIKVYEDSSNSKSGDYVVGYYQSGERVTFWKFGLYNDTANKENILDVYSRIFKEIEIFDNKK